MKCRAETGIRGEALAAELLTRSGCTILARNYRSRFGEIDLIAADQRFLLFVEVKTRTPGGFGQPAEAVDTRKMQRILKTSGFWMVEHPTALQPRFDVIEVLLPERGKPQLHHIENAFDTSFL